MTFPLQSGAWFNSLRPTRIMRPVAAMAGCPTRAKQRVGGYAYLDTRIDRHSRKQNFVVNPLISSNCPQIHHSTIEINLALVPSRCGRICHNRSRFVSKEIILSAATLQGDEPCAWAMRQTGRTLSRNGRTTKCNSFILKTLGPKLFVCRTFAGPNTRGR